jgi:hypothetical protein
VKALARRIAVLAAAVTGLVTVGIGHASAAGIVVPY